MTWLAEVGRAGGRRLDEFQHWGCVGDSSVGILDKDAVSVQGRAEFEAAAGAPRCDIAGGVVILLGQEHFKVKRRLGFVVKEKAAVKQVSGLDGGQALRGGLGLAEKRSLVPGGA